MTEQRGNAGLPEEATTGADIDAEDELDATPGEDPGEAHDGDEIHPDELEDDDEDQ